LARTAIASIQLNPSVGTSEIRGFEAGTFGQWMQPTSHFRSHEEKTCSLKSSLSFSFLDRQNEYVPADLATQLAFRFGKTSSKE